MKALIIALIGLPLVAFFSLAGGTMVWFAWPYAAQAFPAIVNSGYIVPEIGWWSAVCLSFVMQVLVRASQTNSK